MLYTAESGTPFSDEYDKVLRDAQTAQSTLTAAETAALQQAQAVQEQCAAKSPVLQWQASSSSLPSPPSPLPPPPPPPSTPLPTRTPR